jgi:hypothetical protein
MNKHKKARRSRTLELKTETVVQLAVDALKDVVGGNKSTVPSQCVTLCF